MLSAEQHPDTGSVKTWADPERLASLWTLASPTEPLTAREIAGVCFDGRGVVLGDARGAIAVMARAGQGHIRLIAVHPGHRRTGVALGLLQEAEAWLREQAVATVTFGADVPHYLWPGIDARNLPALALAERAGYRRMGCAINLEIPTDCQSPHGVVRVGDDESEAVRELIIANWPAWLTEVELGMRQGTTFAVITSGKAIGFCNHSSLRAGWIGPMGTDPEHRALGVGRALLAAVRCDLKQRGVERAQIAWVGPLGYFADLGATTSRVFCHYRRDL
jgi:GNAT superfamily N-acetyltransferase